MILFVFKMYIWKKRWSYMLKMRGGFRLYMSPYKSNSRGVMVLINNTFDHEIGRIKKILMIILLL